MRERMYVECCVWILGSSPRMTEYVGTNRQNLTRSLTYLSTIPP